MPNIRHEVVIGAPAKEIYDVLTTREGLSGWWTPRTTFTPAPESIARFAFGETYFKEMKIAELKPLQKVKWNCTAGADEWIGTSICFELQPGDKQTLLESYLEAADQIQQQSSEGDMTVLIFSHNDWKDYTPMFAECNYTWGQFLRSLKLLCETGEGRPWPSQHRANK